MFLVEGVSLCPRTSCNVLLLRLHTVPCQCHHCMGQITFSAHVYMSVCVCVYVDAITKGRTPPLSSHGSCKPIGEYPNALRGPCSWGDKTGVRPCCQRDHQWCYLLLAHPLNGGHVVSSGCGKYKYNAYKYKCVCVCVHVFHCYSLDSLV